MVLPQYLKGVLEKSLYERMHDRFAKLSTKITIYATTMPPKPSAASTGEYGACVTTSSVF